jgi:hypothetical protein
VSFAPHTLTGATVGIVIGVALALALLVHLFVRALWAARIVGQRANHPGLPPTDGGETAGPLPQWPARRNMSERQMAMFEPLLPPVDVRSPVPFDAGLRCHLLQPYHSSECHDALHYLTESLIWASECIEGLEAGEAVEHPEGFIRFACQEMLIGQSVDQHG